MGYILRIFYNSQITDIDLSDIGEYTIGSGKNDNFIITDCELKNSHIKLKNKKGKCFVTSNGEVLLGNIKIKNTEAIVNDTYVLNKSKKVAVILLKIAKEQHEVIDLADIDEVLIGREPSCNIVFNNKRVSNNHAKIYKMGNELHISDINSTNGTYINNKTIRDAVLKNGDVIIISKYTIKYNDNKLLISNSDNDVSTNGLSKKVRNPKKYPFFKRSPRLKLDAPKGEIEIQSPPNIGTKPEINWLTVMLPPISMVVIMALVVFATGGNITTLYYTAPMSLIGVMVSIMNYSNQKKKHKKREGLRLQKFVDHIADVTKNIEEKTAEQLQSLSLVHPDANECYSIVSNIERRLWERKPQDADFMSLRIGTGEIDFSMEIKIPKLSLSIDEDSLANHPQKIANKYFRVKNAPIVYQSLKYPTCGIVGDRASVLQEAKNIIIQAATNHCYDELKIITLFKKGEANDFEWIRWLPHVFDGTFGERYMANDVFGASQIFRQLEDVFKQRERELKEEYSYNSTGLKMPFYLFVIGDYSFIEGQSILKYLLNGDPKMGITTLFLFNDLSHLPKDCSTIIDVRGQTGVIYNKENIAEKRNFKLDNTEKFDFNNFSRSMMPIRVPLATDDAMLPSNITFLEGYGVKTPEQLPLDENWANSLTYKSMEVPIGVKANGDKFLFDIHEKKHGPHGLVAGMTGSGKSEMVQSWILSMALKFSPTDVSFVLIDFKGTGLILPFLNMPHLAGTISDLDTNINRNLIALENELSRRKALLDSVGVNNINAYLKLYKDGKASQPLSFLFIVIDEFAEFKVQFPDFMAVVNRIFAIGRTLGVFAVLLTQKPAGVVDDKMYANTRFRWCLKVASSADSKEMIKHPEAAKITNPGRSYVQVGEDEIYELIQSYWSGAPYDPTRKTKASVKPQIYVVDLSGRRVSYDVSEKTSGYKSEINEIDVIIKHLNAHVERNAIKKAQKIWTPKLPKYIPLETITSSIFDGANWAESAKLLSPIIGTVDNPRTQSQYPLHLNVEGDGHIAIYGAPGTGKTTLLQTLIMSLCISYKPDEVNIYVMDFGGWSMGIFRDFPHVGGVANDNEKEKIEKLVRLINKELDSRKKKFAYEGVGNIKAYQNATGEKMPFVILVLDNFTPVFNLYPELEDFFINLTREGGNYGIYLITTCNNSMALGFKMGQNIKMALALQMTEKADYAYIVGRTDGLEPEKTEGRGLVKATPPLEFQTALPVDGYNENDRVAKIKKTAIAMQENWKGKKARPIPIMPEKLSFGSVETNSIAVGLSTKDIEPVSISFDETHYLIISGKHGSGKSNMLRVISKQFIDTMIYVCDFSGIALKSVESIAREYISKPTRFDEFVETLIPILRERRENYAKNTSEIFSPILIVIDDIKQCFDSISDETAKRLEAIVRLGKGLNVNIIAAGNCDDISKLYNQGEPFTSSLVKGSTSVQLGGSLRDHNVFKANLPYNEMDSLVGEFEGYVIHKEKAVRFKAMYQD